MRLYLAGPDVFLPDAISIGAAKKAICAKAGLVGLFPLDKEIAQDGLSSPDVALRIYQLNCDLMDQADIIVANMTPFRGPSLDVGTAFEMGYGAARHKPVFGYSSDPQAYKDRLGGETSDPHGFDIEDFGLPDNLMMLGAVHGTGGTFIARASADSGPHARLAAWEAFQACIDEVTIRLKRDAFSGVK